MEGREGGGGGWGRGGGGRGGGGGGRGGGGLKGEGGETSLAEGRGGGTYVGRAAGGGSRSGRQAGGAAGAAGAQPDLLTGVERLRVTDWFPAERIFPEGDDRDSATRKAVRQAYAALEAAPAGKGQLYYLV